MGVSEQQANKTHAHLLAVVRERDVDHDATGRERHGVEEGALEGGVVAAVLATDELQGWDADTRRGGQNVARLARRVEDERLR